ncbi:FecR family protein [Sphingomonas sanxanigenens]|uniref:FecR protein domain-containing protein n=1 Tax=Sphingomonas sanxanigenens DSM 19645 = NX02 TaxID=1123269 RepID=W0AL29_9SPHN|nr:FecR domain-containing protein [Sphingomonas sanxanigenens]AHE56400.1 hypothetical protein NX02_23950 [Sphingomonas sanxanigenens DSM 19645 = NX02]
MVDAHRLRPTPDIVRRAAEWAAELDDARVAAARRDACEAWCAEDQRHRLAFDRMRLIGGRFEGLDPVGRNALARVGRATTHGKRAAGGLLAIALLAVGGGWLAMQSFTLRSLLPDHRTAPGEQRPVILADGSRLDLDTGTAVSLRESGSARRIDLYEGRLMAEVMRDRDRPFTIVTHDGTATALGTRFSVRREGRATIVTVIESRVRVCPGAETGGPNCRDLGAGERALIRRGAVRRMAPVGVEQASAWTKGWLEADDMPIAEALAELNRYRTRPARIASTTSRDIRITGSFSLTDSDASLRAIAATNGLIVTPTADGVVLHRAH